MKGAGDQRQGDYGEPEKLPLPESGRRASGRACGLPDQHYTKRGDDDQGRAEQTAGGASHVNGLRRVAAIRPVKVRTLQQIQTTKQAQYDDEGDQGTHDALRLALLALFTREQVGVPSGLGQAEVLPDGVGGDAPAWCALQIALLDEIRLKHVFDGIG